LKDVRSVVEATIVKVRTSPLFARSGLMGGYRGAKLSRGTALIRQSVPQLFGFVAGTRKAIKRLKTQCRSWIFTIGMTTANAATALAAIDIAKTDPSPSDLA
jgi:hypothetical protein